MDRAIDLTENRMFQNNRLFSFFEEEDEWDAFDEELFDRFYGNDRCLFYGTGQTSLRRVYYSIQMRPGYEDSGSYFQDRTLDEFSTSKFSEDGDEWARVHRAAYTEFWDKRYQKFLELISKKNPQGVNDKYINQVYNSFQVLVSRHSTINPNIFTVTKEYLQRDEDSETLEEKWLSLEVANSRSTFNTNQFISYTRGFNCFVERPYYNILSLNKLKTLSSWFRSFLTHRRNKLNRFIRDELGQFIRIGQKENPEIKLYVSVLETDLDDEILESIRRGSPLVESMNTIRFNIYNWDEDWNAISQTRSDSYIITSFYR